MDLENIKNKVINYDSCSIDDIDEILNYIADRKREELGIDFEFETIYDTGGCVEAERTSDGRQKVEIGSKNITDMKLNKEMRDLAKAGMLDAQSEIPEVNPVEERKEFIELILATFHELRHVKQNDNITDHPVNNSETKKMTREQIINESFPGFRGANYDQSMMEIDAMKTSLEETAMFFKEMGSDITPDEVFEVMKEKEIAYLKYDLQDFGDSYESALDYFNQIYGKQTSIENLSDIIDHSMDKDKREMLYSKYRNLLDEYNSETSIEAKLDILQKISIKLNPQLTIKYPLANEELVEENPHESTTNENLAEKAGQSVGVSFESILQKAGFNKGCIDRLKHTIMSMTHKPKDVEKMDKAIENSKEQELTNDNKEKGEYNDR